MRRGTSRTLWSIGVSAVLIGALAFLATRTDPTLNVGLADRPLIIATAQEPDTMDPTSTRDSSTVFPILGGNENRANVFEPLVLTPKGSPITPNLARSWNILDGGKIIEFKLRPGVLFHSGDKLTAADVVFSQQRMTERSPQYKNWMRRVERVEAVDEETVRFVFSSPDATFFTRIGPIASKAYYDRVGEAEFTTHPMGTGAYKFAGRKLGQYLDLEAFDRYHDGPLGKPQIRRVRYVFVPDNAARIAMLRAGEADIIVDTPFHAVKQIKELGFKTVQVAVIPTVIVQFDNRNKKTPWADPRVRLAMAHAIDADSIVSKVLYGVPKRYAALSPGELGYDPNLKPYAYDPELARRLLAQAGYPNGFTMPLYYWIGSFEGVKETAEAVTLNLLAVGIKADVRGLDGARILELLRKTVIDDTVEYVGVMPVPIAHTPEPAFALMSVFLSQSAMAPYANPALDKIIARVINELEPEKRAVEIAAAYRMLHADVGAIPIWAAVKTLAMRPEIDYVPASSESVRLVNVSWERGS
jgi:peptide/nickel transport system substrate-binding protein